MRKRKQDQWKATTPVRRGHLHPSQGVPTKVPTDGRQLLATVKSFRAESSSVDIDESDSLCETEVAPREIHDSTIQGGARLALLNSLQETYQRCQQPDWDGEQAKAISIETFEVARRFIEALPRHAPLPTVTPEPDGQLNFEWYHSPRRLLTVSLSGSGTLHWAALIGSEDPRGSCPFVDQFPKTLLYWISQVFE